MFTGEMNTRIGILKHDVCNWVKIKSVWGKCNEKNSRCVYSQNGVSSLKTMTVTTYKDNEVTETNLLQIANKKYLPVAIIPNKNSIYCDIICAQVSVKEMLTYETKDIIDENRCVTKANTQKKIQEVIFANKYVNMGVNAVYNTENRAFIIIIPKEIRIDAGSIVKIDDVFYYVTICLEYGEYFNEYQIEVKEDV